MPEPDFKLISVGDDDDDEIVIQAGVTNSSNDDFETAEDDFDASADFDEADAEALESLEADAQELGADEQPFDEEAYERFRKIEGIDENTARLLAEADDESRTEYLKHLSARRARELENMVTTQEDLRSKGPFIKMQYVIVGLAVIAIIVFAVYFGINYGS